MTDQLISFETAKLAKEKGFNQNPFTAFNSHIRCAYGPEYTDGSNIKLRTILFNPESNVAVAPTQSLLQKWLREVHNMSIEIGCTINKFWIWHIYEISSGELLLGFTKHSESYEEALEASLREALLLIK